jgi:hypothetical protein
MVEEKARTATHIGITYPLVNMALIEKFSQWLQITRLMDSDNVTFTYKYIYLTGRGNSVCFVINREVKHDEKVVWILIDFGALYSAQHIIQIERMEVEVLSQIIHVLRSRLLNVNPGQLTTRNRVQIGLLFLTY